ncbi:MAG: type II secretion system F family protein [Kineosporiaceae bacterium]|nr:type II secretion system F family protein [Aeromicrobium sp.]
MIAALTVGAVAGAGLLTAGWALVPPRQDLAAAVGRFDAHRARTRLASSPAQRLEETRLGQVLRTMTSRRGLIPDRVRADLALLDRSVESHLVAKLIAGSIGLAIPTSLVVALAAAGVSVGLVVPAFVGVALAVAFSFLPDVSVKQVADRRRGELRRALACYLDLVSMALAGGRGAPEALPSAANIGRGWAFELIADTLTYARYTGVTPWDALKQLGERVDVAELRDLGNALALVSDDGAKIKESLQARAATARKRQLAEAEGAAEKASESIKNAHLLLGFSFLLFLGFPAVAAVLAV